MFARLPVRIRLAAGFCAGLTVVLVLAGAFVYVEVSQDLSDALDTSLAARADDAGTLIEGSVGPVDLGGVRAGEEETTFTQILTPGGRVVESTLPGSESVLSAQQQAAAGEGPVRAGTVRVPGLEGPFRALALPVSSPSGTVIAVVGASSSDRVETLAGIRRAFALGGPAALLIASAIGYALGGRALAPVEAMRSRAQEITLDRDGERLPRPAADDELRSLADTLNEMLDRVEGALQRERVFVSDASHELRTPLAILKSEIELVRRTGGSKADLEAALGSAGEEVEHLVLLAEDLLVIARAEQGGLPLRREPVAVQPLLEELAARFRSQAADAGRMLTVAAAGCGVYEIDRTRVEQAISNLVDNALRYGEGEINVRAEGDEHRLRLSVSDQGVGFPGAFEAEAFERFSQADSGRSDSGTGLGLAIVRAIARAHDGEAEIIGGLVPGAAVELRLSAERVAAGAPAVD